MHSSIQSPTQISTKFVDSDLNRSARLFSRFRRYSGRIRGISIPPLMKTPTRRLCQIVLALFLVSGLPSCSREARAQRKLDSAKERIAKGDYPGAEIEYKNVLDIEPGNLKAMRGLGLIWIEQGASYDGAQILMRLRDKYPNDDEVGIAFARGMFNLGFLKDSRQALFQVLDRSPADGDALMLLADTSFSEETIAETQDRIERSKATNQPKVMLTSALLELRQGLIDSGTATVRRILELDPKQPRAQALMGTILRARKQPDAAREPMKKAADLAGPRSQETSNYASLLMELERPDDAIRFLLAATKAAPDYLPNWRVLGYIAYTENKDKEATEYFAKVLAKSPLDLEASELQAQIWVRGNDARKAVNLLEKLAQTYPGRPTIEFSLAKAYLAAGETNKATAALDKVLEVMPGATEAAILRIHLYLKEGKAQEAIRDLEPIVASQPTNRTAQDLLIGAYNAADRNQDAAALLRKQAAASGDDPAPLLKLGALLVTEKKPSEARQTFVNVLKIDPENFAAIYQLAALDEEEGKPSEASKRVDDFLAKHPESADAHVFKARLLYSRKDFLGAESLLQKALTLKGGQMDAYGMLVQILAADNRKGDAVTLLADHLKTNPPQDVNARMQLGSLLVELNRNEEARDCFEKLVALHPDFASAYNNLAFLYSERLANLDKAAANAKKARDLDPRNPAMADTLGWIEWLRGNYADALPLLEEAVTGLPAYPSARYHLAMTHDKLGHLDVATKELEKAIAIPGDFPEKSAAVGRLAALQSGSEDLPALEKLSADNPADASAQLQLAKALEVAGRFADAVAAYDRASKANPNLEAAYLGKFQLYANKLNEPAKALDAAKQSRRAAPTSMSSAAALGTAYYLNDNYESAYGLLKDATNAPGADSELIAYFAKTAYAFGRIPDARAAMKKAIDSGIKSQKAAQDFLTLTAPDAAKNPDTQTLAEKTLAENPDSVPALMLLARTADPKISAADTYLKVLKVDPDFDPAKKELAMLLLDDPTKNTEVEKLATDARRRMTDDADLTGILAIVNFRKQKYDYAIQLLKELGSGRPLTAREFFALGMSQAASGKPAEAKEALGKAIQGELPEADAAKAKTTLEDLSKEKTDK
jgi:tetratricopeptide (TPR) repeat protein